MIRALQFLGKRRLGFADVIGPIAAVILARNDLWWSAAGALMLGFVLMAVCWAATGDADFFFDDEDEE